MIKIVGLFVEDYIEEFENLDYETDHHESIKYHLYAVEDPGYKWKISLWEGNGPCGSGYCMSSWGYMEIEPVRNFGPMNYIPKGDYPVLNACITWKDGAYIWKENEESEKRSWDHEIDNDIFSYDYDGGDGYYPSGYGYVKMDRFERLKRDMNKRPVWIFSGASGLGKSTLGEILGGRKDVFETDSVNELPDEIYADVVILGNRSKFTVEDVIGRLFGKVKVILVSFSEYAEEKPVKQEPTVNYQTFLEYVKSRKEQGWTNHMIAISLGMDTPEYRIHLCKARKETEAES